VGDGRSRWSSATKVLLCETAEKFITDYEVYEKQQPDCDLTSR